MRRLVTFGQFALYALSCVLCVSRVAEAENDCPEPPAGAVAAGFNRLVFQEEFRDLSGIDIHDSRKPGFNFYPKLIWGKYVMPREHIRVEDGILHLVNPENHAQGDLFSAVSTGRPKEWTGFTASKENGGAYFEASIAFDPGGGPVDGFPAFWTMAAEHFFGNLRPAPYQYLEMDFMEYNPTWYDDPTDYLQGNHIWTVDASGKRSRDPFPKPHRAMVIDTPRDTDFKRFNVFGCLWVPGPDGRIDTYFNNRLMRSVSSRNYPDVSRVGDNLRYPVILGCGEWPMRVDWVRVWSN